MKGVNIIPQVFYDLIARIVPGVILLLCTFLVYFGSEQAAQHTTTLMGKKATLFKYPSIFSSL